MTRVTWYGLTHPHDRHPRRGWLRAAVRAVCHPTRAIATVNVSDDAVAFIKQFEGFSSHAYWDVSRWSIGHGTVSFEGEKITREVATERLKTELAGFAAGLQNRLTFQPTDTQTTALLSAAFNLGVVGIRPVIELCNDNDFQAAADLLREYDHAGGERLQALTCRRDAEAQLLETEGRPDMGYGAPRIQYERSYWLMPPDASDVEFAEVAKVAFGLRGTLGFSADDAGIGDLDDKSVVLVYPKRQPAGIKEWFAAHYPGVQMSEYPNIVPVAPRPPVSQTKALVGLHGSADGSWGNPVLPETVQLIKQGKIKAYKALSNESADTVKVLRSIDPDIFIMVRLFTKVNRENPSAAAFVEAVLEDAVKWYNSGVRHYEVHNEPNLKLADESGEGMWTVWHDGAEFATWFRQVTNALKPHMPDALFGYPGLSPGWSVNNVRYDPIRFLEESWQAVDQADFICTHCYWTTPAEMHSDDGGQWYRRVPHAGKPLMITEFSNPSHDVDKHEKGKQYVDYYASLENVHSAYSFLSTSSSGFVAETWHGSDIAHTVGQRDGSTA